METIAFKFHGQHKMKAVVKQLHGHWTMEC